MFLNAKSVEINEKEVKSIILENGAILYKKDESYPLSITSDKNILSYYDNESATLTATLTNNGVPVEGEKIQFISTNSIEKEIHDSGNYSEIGRYFEVDLSNLPVGQYYNIGGDDSISSKISLHKYQNGTIVFVGNSGEGIVLNDIVYFEDTQLRYINSINGKEIIKDISNYDLSIWNKFSVDLSADVLVKYPVFYRSGVTDVNGQCSVTYDSQGIGDVSINVECMNLQETYSIEDCFYWNDTEIQITDTNKHTLYDSDLSVALPTNAEISFDVNTVTTSTLKDYRWWFMSKSLFSGMTYPSNSLYFDKKPSYILYNQRANGSDKYSAKQFTASAYANIKYVKNGTTVKVYVDDTLMFEDTVSWIENYSDYTISAMKWSGSETMKMKNVKFKAL